MMIRIFSLFFLLLLSSWAWGLSISKVDVHCDEELSCTEFEGKFDLLRGTWSEEQLRERVRLFLFDPSIQKLSVEVVQEEGGDRALVNLTPHRTIGSVLFHVNYAVDLSDLKKAFPYKENEIYDESKASEAYAAISRYLSEHGFAQENIALQVDGRGNQVDLKYDVKINKVIKINKVYVDFDTPVSLQPIKERFRVFSGELWDQLKFKIMLEQVLAELFEQGYFYSKLELLPTEKDSSQGAVNLHLKGTLGERFLFSFAGNKIFSTQELLAFVKKSIKETPNVFDPNELGTTLKKEYERLGLYNNRVTFSILKGQDRFGTALTQIHFKILEGFKIPVQQIIFTGNTFFSDEQILSYFKEQASEISKRDFFDLEDLNRFSSILRKKYLAHGHVLAEVSEPYVVFDEKHSKATVEYKIKEKEQTFLSSIEVTGVSSELSGKVIESLKNKSGTALDVTVIQEDLARMMKILRDEGFYFAQIKNLESESLLTYSPDATSATLTLNVDLGKKTIIDSFLVTGNQKTKNKVITREIEVKPGRS